MESIFILVKVIFTIQNTNCLKIYIHAHSSLCCMHVCGHSYISHSCQLSRYWWDSHDDIICTSVPCPAISNDCPNFRKDWHSNWIRLVILRTDESASACARASWPIKCACALYARKYIVVDTCMTATSKQRKVWKCKFNGVKACWK